MENASYNRINSLVEFLKQQNSVISISQTVGFCELEFRVIISHINIFFELMEIIRNHFPDIIRDYDSIIYHEFYRSLNYIPFA